MVVVTSGEMGQLPVPDVVAVPLKETEVQRSGVLLEPSLSLEAQVASVARSAFGQLLLVWQPQMFVGRDGILYWNPQDSVLAVHSMWGYLWIQSGGFSWLKMLLLRLLLGADYCQHVTPELKCLHRLPVCYQVRFKVLNNLGSEYLKDLYLIP